MRRLCPLLALVAPLLHAQVTFDRIIDASKEPRNWLTYSGTPLSQRHSLLTQINPANVKNLELQWVFQSQSLEKFEASPLVVDGVLYTVQAPNDAVAMDAETGRIFWVSPYAPSPEARVCCGRVNRGLAILGDTLFMGTIDGHLLALDAKTGKGIWNVTVAKAEAGYALTLAPLVVKDKVIVGTAGGEYGIRGFLAAYDAKTGKEAWRFNAIPGPGEPRHETWAGDSWMHGGASIWVTGSYDPQLNLTYWGIGNPGPDWNSDDRAGANLYSDSVVALDADTGKLKWYFQFSPHDDFDYDSVQVPVLADMEWKGKTTAGVAMGESQRLLLRARPRHRRIPAGQAIRKGDMDDGTRRRRTPCSRRRSQAFARRYARLSRRAGRDQLVLAVIQPAHWALLHQHLGKLRVGFQQTPGRLRRRTPLHRRLATLPCSLSSRHAGDHSNGRRGLRRPSRLRPQNRCAQMGVRNG